MTTFAILATGQSLTPGQVALVHDAHSRRRCKTVAVSNAWELAPWADALVSNDNAWWRRYPEALEFAGRKFSASSWRGLERLAPSPMFPSGSNSGLQSMRVALMLGASRILLIGFDMHGTHYFGPHPKELKNAVTKDFRRMLAQFNRWNSDAEVINCTPGSALKKFPVANLEEII